MGVVNVIDFNAYRSSPRRSFSSEFFCAPFCEVLAAAAGDAAMLGMGSPDIRADGTVQRFPLPEDRGGKKSGWALAWADGIPTVIISSWKTGDTVKVTGADERFRTSASAAPVSREAVEANRRRMEEAQAKREAERREADAQAVAQSAAMYGAAAPAPADSPYLVRKGVTPVGGVRRTEDGVLLVPLYGSSGSMEGVQRIYPDGSKKFVFGLAKKGRFAFVGDPNGDLSQMLVCEGFATGASLHMATGMPVLCAIDCGNVEAACETWLAARPGTKFAFCADNDRWTVKKGVPWNPGVEAMQKAAAKFGGRVCIPDFQSLDGNPTDFNDLHQREGLAAVSQSGKFGYIGENGSVEIPFEYDSAGENPYSFRNGLVPVTKDAKFGILDRRGREIVSFDFDKILQGKDGKYIANKGGKWGILTVNEELFNAANTTTAPQTGTVENYRVTTSGSTLNLRAEPSVYAQKLTEIPNGTAIIVESVEGEWAKVKYGAYSGYVSANYITQIQ